MTKEEYKENAKVLYNEYQKNLRLLNIKCAMENNDVNVGDKFTDHIGTILVESIGMYVDHLCSLPMCRYVGLVLKKDGTPTKKNERRDAFQENRNKNQ